MAYGQNDHDYAYPRTGKTFLDIIKENPEYSGYASDGEKLIWLNNDGVVRQTLRNIARGPQNLTENQLYWIKSNAKILFTEEKMGKPYQKGTENPHVPGPVADIFYEMFRHIFEPLDWPKRL